MSIYIYVLNFGHNMLNISKLIIKIDALINKQLNTVLHHQKLQALEASWRGLHYLIDQAASNNSDQIKIRVLNISWTELSKDLSRHIEFDQSQLFQKIYSNEFGQAGGEPFGLLIGDYQITHRSEHINTLRAISKIAASAFAPFVTAADANLFGLDNFFGFERKLDFDRTFQQAEYREWKSLRDDEDARFIGLVLPRVLIRTPYNKNKTITHPIYFLENSNQIEHYLWSNAAYQFAAIVIRAFAQNGWFADIRGTQQNKITGGLVTELARDYFCIDEKNLTTKYITDVCITDQLEKTLSDHGFIALSECKYTEFAAFYSCPSIQKPKSYDRVNATQNANLSSMLHYVLCVSRFAHYIKVIMRDKVGTFTSASDCEYFLQNWLQQYTASATQNSYELQAKYPLRAAKVKIQDHIGKPGSYLCKIHLAPHYQLDQMESYLQLTTEITNYSR